MVKKISYIEDNKDKKLCFVRASKRIRNRALKLKIPNDQIIAVFIESKKVIKKKCFIDNVHISTILQETASNIYNITCKEELARFNSHSIRVGACVPLHAQNKSSEDIQFCLRWRSDYFRIYLRNITQLAERHRDAQQLSFLVKLTNEVVYFYPPHVPICGLFLCMMISSYHMYLIVYHKYIILSLTRVVECGEKAYFWANLPSIIS